MSGKKYKNSSQNSKSQTPNEKHPKEMSKLVLLSLPAGSVNVRRAKLSVLIRAKQPSRSGLTQNRNCQEKNKNNTNPRRNKNENTKRKS